jgi:DivIVA domain-containing protein
MGQRVGHTGRVRGNEPPHQTHDQGETPSSVPPARGGAIDVRDPPPDEIRDPSFPASVRGYSRPAVDAYVERVNTVIAELQVSGSPRAAVRHALDRVGEQTSGILQHARETAEEITTSAREEAEEKTARAQAEAQDITTDAQRQASDAISGATAKADDIVARARTKADELLKRANEQSENTLAQARIEADTRAREVHEEIDALREDAEARIGSLQANIAAISDKRRTLLDEVRRIAARLEAVVAEAEPAEDETPPETPPTPEPPATVTTHPTPQTEPNGSEADNQPPQGTTTNPET